MDPKLAQQFQSWTAQLGTIPGTFKWAQPAPAQADPTPAASKEPRGRAHGWWRRHGQNHMANRGFRDAARRNMTPGQVPAAPGLSSRISPGTVPMPNSAQPGPQQPLAGAYDQWKKP